MIGIIHALLFLVGTVIIYWFNRTENIGIIASFMFSFIAVIWNSYKFFDDKKWKKNLTKIKFLNQKSLEIYKIYVLKKIDNITRLHEDISTMIFTCGKLNANLALPLNYNEFTENDFKILFNDSKITNITYQNDIILYWKKHKSAFNFNAQMQSKIRNVIYTEYSNNILRLRHSFDIAQLYLKEDDFNNIKKLIQSIGRFFISQAPIKNKPFNTKEYNKINKTFNDSIVPILKKALEDIDDVSQ